MADEVAAKEKVWDSRFDFDRLLRQATLALADRTHTLVVAATDTGDIYSAGVANILSMPEFFDIDITRTVLSLLDQEARIHQLFSILNTIPPSRYTLFLAKTSIGNISNR